MDNLTINILDFKKNVLTYLPPMEKPTTSYEVIFEMFTGSGQLSKQANIIYTHITLDVNVAIIEFHVQWNQPEN